MLARLRQKYNVFRFMLVYRTHLGKHKTLNVGAAATTSFYFYAYIQDASRQAQNSKCWRAASAKKLHFRDIAEGIYIKKYPAAGEFFFTFRDANTVGTNDV